MQSDFSRVHLPAIGACVLWGTAFAFVKIGLQYCPPLTFAGVRFVLAGLILLPFCGSPKTIYVTVAGNFRYILMVSFLQTILLYSLFFIGMTLTSGAQAAMVIGSSPLVTGLMAHILLRNEKLDLKKSTALAVGLLGIIIISLATKPWQPGGSREFTGLAILLGCVLSSTAANIYISISKKTVNAIILNSVQISFGGLVLLLTGLVSEPFPGFSLPASFYLSVAWLALISAVSFSIWFHLLKKAKVSHLNIWKFLIPVSGVLLSWFILPDESPDFWTVTGMLLIGSSIMLFYIDKLLTKN